MRFLQIATVVLLATLASSARGQATGTSSNRAESAAEARSEKTVEVQAVAQRPDSPAVSVAKPEVGSTLALPADVDQYASCVLQIDSVASDYPAAYYNEALRGSRFDSSTVALLASSTTFLQPALESALKRPAQLGRQVLIGAVPAGARFVRLEVSLKKTDKPWPHDAANTLLRTLVDRLRAGAEESLNAEMLSQKKRIVNLGEDLAAAKSRLAEITTKLRDVRDAMGQTGEYSGSDPSYVLQNLRTQKRQIELELSRFKSRLSALDKEEADGAVAAWEAAVKSQEERLAMLREMQKAGKATPEKIAEQETMLAESKNQLATTRARALSNPGARGFQVNEIRGLKLNIAEQESRLKPIFEQLAKLEAPGIAEKLSDFREMTQEEQRLHNEVSEVAQRLNLAQRAVRDRAPTTITVLGGQGK